MIAYSHRNTGAEKYNLQANRQQGPQIKSAGARQNRMPERERTMTNFQEYAATLGGFAQSFVEKNIDSAVADQMTQRGWDGNNLRKECNLDAMLPVAGRRVYVCVGSVSAPVLFR